MAQITTAEIVSTEDVSADLSGLPSAESEISSRNYSLDLLRILAVVGVVCIHVSTKTGEALSDPWVIIINTWGGGYWAVPVFFMLSGAFLLSSKSDMSVVSLYKKRLPRILLPLIFWNAFYLACFWKFDYETFNQVKYSIFLKGVVYHLWFLYPLLGLYLLTPFLRRIVRACTRTELYIFVSICVLFHILIGSNIAESPYFIGRAFSWCCFFVAGYLLLYYPLHIPKTVLIVSGLGVLWLSEQKVPYVRMLIPVIIFALFSTGMRIPDCVIPYIRRMAKATLGIYLVHVLVMSVYFPLVPFDNLYVKILLGIPIVFIASMCVTMVLQCIPYIRRVV